MTGADSSMSGKTVPCMQCKAAVTVPESTPERVEAGKEFESVAAVEEPVVDFTTPELTADQIRQMAYAKADEETANAPISQRVSSRLNRWLGSFIDGMAMLGAAIAGTVLAASLAGPTPSVADAILTFTPMAMLAFCQLFLTATEGRTIGKYCLGMKIIDSSGNPPGFVQGVLLRIVAVGALSVIPLFSLVNVLWIFASDENRCLHDLIAGTHVVNA